jgi:hypothetical protein
MFFNHIRTILYDHLGGTGLQNYMHWLKRYNAIKFFLYLNNTTIIKNAKKQDTVIALMDLLLVKFGTLSSIKNKNDHTNTWNQLSRADLFVTSKS